MNFFFQQNQVLKEVHWQLREGEKWALLGGNGAGKSTLLKLVHGDLWPDPSSPGRRRYFLNGEAQESALGVREQMALVSAESQDAYRRHGWDMPVFDAIGTGFTQTAWLQGSLTSQQHSDVERVLARLGIEDLAGKRTLELSLGESRKMLLARALVRRPKVLLLDEFLSGLDGPSRAALIRLLSQLAEEGRTIVQTSHRAEELLPETTHVAVMDQGRIVRCEARTGATPEGLAESASNNSCDVCHSGIEPASSERSPVLIHADADAVHRDGHLILRDVEWTLREGEHWGVLGANGSGKSTFLRLLHGDEVPERGGTVSRFDLPELASVWEVKKRFGFVSAELQATYEYNLRVLDVVLSGFFASIGLYDEVTAEQESAGLDALRRAGAADLVERRYWELSYGQRRRVLLARALVRRPRVLLLDEPCTGLDASARAELLNMLPPLAAEGVSIIMTTHHRDELLPLFTHLAVFEGGRIVAQGRRAEVEGTAGYRELFGQVAW